MKPRPSSGLFLYLPYGKFLQITGQDQQGYLTQHDQKRLGSGKGQEMAVSPDRLPRVGYQKSFGLIRQWTVNSLIGNFFPPVQEPQFH